MTKLISAAILTLVALVFAWIACWLAVDAAHAWQVVTTLSAFGFGIAAFVFLANWVVDGE